MWPPGASVPMCSSSEIAVPLFYPLVLFSLIIGWLWVEAQIQGVLGVPMMLPDGHLHTVDRGQSMANDIGIHFLEGYAAHIPEAVWAH